MSHEATNWAFEQPEQFPDMKPAEWAVLMVLANCHNPVYGCFPSQEYLSAKTNQDPRSVRRQLQKLRSRKLVNWGESRKAGKRESNRYLMAFESDFVAHQDDEILPDKLSGRDVSTGQNEQFLPDKFDSFYRTNCPPKEVKESVIEPVSDSVSEKTGEIPVCEKGGSVSDPPSQSANLPTVEKPTSRQILIQGLGEQNAIDLIEHRKKLRKPLTARAARLLVGEIVKSGDRDAAVDAIVSQGWIGFKAAWLENLNQRNTRPGGDRPSGQKGGQKGGVVDYVVGQMNNGEWR